MCVWRGGVCLNQADGVHPFSHTHSHTYTTFSSREFDLLTVITSLSLRPAVGTNHFQTPSAIVSDTNVQLTPCLEGLDAVLNDSPHHFFLLFPPHRVSFCRGHTQNFCRRKWASTSEQILPSNRTFPLKSLVLQPGLRVVLCPRFSAENDAAEGPSWDGISTPCAARLGSPERRNVDRNPERSELWARWSAPTRALLPPLSQLTLGAHSAQTPSHGHSVNYKYSFPVRNVKCLHSGTDFMKLYPWVYAFVQF